jgi:hypothetical protein
MLVETIYRPTLKDAVSGLRQTRFAATFASATAAATSVQSATSVVVPADTARFITGFSASAVAGAAQFLNEIALTLGIAGTFTTVVQVGPNTRVAATQTYLYVPLDLLALPGETLIVIANFDAGGVNNTLNNAYVWGYDIPRANLSA